MTRLTIGFTLLALGLAAAVWAEEDKPAEIKGWGTVMDPDGDCTIREDNGKVTIKVPETIHDLWFGRKDARRRFNAPRVWQAVEGDFLAQVKMTSPNWKLGAKFPDGTCHRGAGLSVWDSEQQYLRLERTQFLHSRLGTPHWFTTPLYDVKGKRVGAAKFTDDEFFKGRSTWLRLERAGQTITTWISHDGKEWTETGKLTTQFPKRVQVGVHVLNGCQREFVVEFEDFAIRKK